MAKKGGSQFSAAELREMAENAKSPELRKQYEEAVRQAEAEEREEQAAEANIRNEETALKERQKRAKEEEKERKADEERQQRDEMRRNETAMRRQLSTLATQARKFETNKERDRYISLINRYRKQLEDAKSPEDQEAVETRVADIESDIAGDLGVMARQAKAKAPSFTERIEPTLKTTGKVARYSPRHSASVRVEDAAIAAGTGGGSVLLAAAQNHANQTDLLWSGLFAVAGAIMAMEGEGIVKYGGYGLLGGNGGYMTLRVLGGLLKVQVTHSNQPIL